MFKRFLAHRADVFCCVFLSAIYGAILFFGQRRALWYDEIFTWNIARLPSLPDIWNALRDGVDLNPPLSYLLVRASQSVFGDGTWGTRLPSVLALCITALCLYFFIARRASRVVALGVALLPLASKAFLYGFEARPYALLLMCGAASLLCYSFATDQNATSSTRSRSRIAMALCLAIAVSSHYFGVFLLWPLLVGEAVRYRQSRRFSRALLVAMSVGIAPLFFFLPLLRDAKRYASDFWAQPEIVKDSQMFLAQFLELFWIVALVNICGILVVMLRSSSWRMRREKIESRITPIKVAMTIPIHEIAAIVALALLPIVCVTAALLAHSGYVFRYAAAGVVGACLLLGIVAAWVEKRLPATRWMFLTACLLCVFINQVTQSVWRREGEDRVLERSARLQQTVRKSVPPELPIVVGSSRRFLELSHYAPPDLRRRLVYLTNVSLSLRYLKNDTGDLAMLKLARYAPISVRDYRNFFNNNRRFILLDSGGGDQWIVPHLRASGVVWKLSVKAEGEQFYIVDLGANYSR